MELITKFLLRVEIDEISGCWQWLGAKKTAEHPYGMFCVNNKSVRAHRWSYEFFIGEIPKNHQLDHFACRNKSCVNPYHLQPLTQQQHLEQPDSMVSLKRGQTHCKRGHIFNEENLHVDANGSRQCRVCRRYREKRARLRGTRK